MIRLYYSERIIQLCGDARTHCLFVARLPGWPGHDNILHAGRLAYGGDTRRGDDEFLLPTPARISLDRPT